VFSALDGCAQYVTINRNLEAVLREVKVELREDQWVGDTLTSFVGRATNCIVEIPRMKITFHLPDHLQGLEIGKIENIHLKNTC
jgi:hypothetical protein